ncbi:DUF3631 domain-containing protein [Dactylosporangium sp. CA-092794]|uniref:DUF3631 domain-containing protein n=1 Tax=Dactylosporangium sp. CA-092794 TaxID=3239929 RepID=UPI003D8B1E5E
MNALHTGAVDPGPPQGGVQVLDDVAAFFRRYIAFPTEHAFTAVALWAAHTHAPGCFYVTPRLVLDSAEPGSGKTRVLELLNLLCRYPEMTISASTAALFRLINDKPRTILFDEIDAIFNPKNGGNFEDLRALLNAGYKRGATIARCVGDAKTMAVQRFPVFSPAALAGLAGNMPSTILTRAVVVHMRRRKRSEHVEPFREKLAEREAEPIRESLAAWVADVAHVLAAAEPVMPAGVVDRPAEVWEALLAVADAAGGHWPGDARAACEHFALTTATPPTLGTRLLADLRTVFNGRDRVATAEILAALVDMEGAPWGEIKGKPLDSRVLAELLARYRVSPLVFKNDQDKATRGYTAFPKGENVGLADAWDRYLPALQRNERNERNHAGQDRYGNVTASVTDVTGEDQVTDASVTVTASVTALTRQVTPVTPVTPSSGPRRPRSGEGAAA